MASDDIYGGGKNWKWIVLAIIVIGLPTFCMTDFALEKAQKLVNEKAQRMAVEGEKQSWAGTLQKWIALAYSIKFEHRISAERYEWASRFAFNAGDDDGGAWMLFNQAVEVEAADSNGKWAALPMYESIATTYADRPAGARAANNVTRIKTMSRP